MYFNCKRIAVSCALLIAPIIGHAQQQPSDTFANSQDMEMIVQPNKCVALTQGRRCYAQVNITWQAKQLSSVCLIEIGSLKKLNCWVEQFQGQYTYEMESAEDITLSLVPTSAIPSERETVLVSTTIEVSWLYEGSARKRRWRLF